MEQLFAFRELLKEKKRERERESWLDTKNEWDQGKVFCENNFNFKNKLDVTGNNWDFIFWKVS